MKKLIRFTAATVLGLSLTTGMVAASSASIDNTGPDSRNTVEFRNKSERRVNNDNNVRVENNNPQDAESGDADVTHNTMGGDAETGAAENDSWLSAHLSVDNSGSGHDDCGCPDDDEASIEKTGPDSHNRITFRNEHKVNVDNDNYIRVVNNNEQWAGSGDANVDGNTTGGSATSGDASNVSTTEVVVEIVN